MLLSQLLTEFGYVPDYKTKLNPKDQFKHEALDRAQTLIAQYGMLQGELTKPEILWFRHAFLTCLCNAASDVFDQVVRQQIATEQSQVLERLDQLIDAA